MQPNSKPWLPHITPEAQGIVRAPGYSLSDATLGTRKRAALFLATEVGEGGVFTTKGLRLAIPDVEQIDRRARELRGHGWQISSYKDDPVTLRKNEHRVDKIGDQIWH